MVRVLFLILNPKNGTGKEIGLLVRIHLGPLAKDKPLTIPVEWFVSMLRFDSKVKLDELGFELSL